MALQLLARFDVCRDKAIRTLQQILIVGGLGCGSVSLASTEIGKAELLDSDLIVSAVKLSGRVSCSDLRNYRDQYNDEIGSCYGSKQPGSISEYNRSIDSEDFLVLSVLRGNVDKFSILEIPYQDVLAGGDLELGEAYILFLSNDAGIYSYQPCRSTKYTNVAGLIKSGTSLEKIIEFIYSNNKFECPELTTQWESEK